MKPLLLKLQAFGPFAAKESINFSALGHNPLFLINGPTGAGKSTILDAICFALYGQTTGAEREPSQMRCDVAEASLLTEVSLDFSLGVKKYRVRRVPQQDKPKTRGEGSTSHNPEAQLWELDGSDTGVLLVARKVNDASSHIKELIGLDVEQFRQVMVLPQGKFRELLLADSSEREKIFSQLFQTQMYKRLEELLKSKASGIKHDVERHQSEIRGILQVAELNTEAEVTAALAQLQPLLAAAVQARAATQADRKASETLQEQALQLQKRFIVLAQQQQLLAQKTALAPAIESQQRLLDKALNADVIRPLFNNTSAAAIALEKLEQQLASNDAELTVALQQAAATEQALLLAQGQAEALPQLRKQEMNFQQLQQQSLQLNGAGEELVAVAATLATVEEHIADKRQTQLALSTERDAGEAAVARLSLQLEGLAEQKMGIDRLSTQLELRAELELNRTQQRQQIAHESRAQHAFQASEITFASAQTASKNTELNWHAGQAALLARELQRGECCPVCGSLEHPQPAAGDSELVDKGAVDQSRALTNTTREALELSRQHLQQANNALVQTAATIQRFTIELGPQAEEPLALLQQKHADQLKELTSLAAKQDQRRQLQLRGEAIKPQQAKLELELTALNRQLASRNEDVVRVRTEVERLTALLPAALRERGALSQALAAVVTSIAQLSANLSAAQQAQVTARSNSDKSSSRQQAFEQQHREQCLQQSASTATWQRALATSLFTSEADFQQALLETQAQKSLQADIGSYRSALDALRGAVEQMQAEVAQAQQPDLAAIDAALASSVERHNVADSAWLTLEQRSQQLLDIERKLARAHRENEALEAEYAVIGTLSEVANGQTGNKISLQRFVLSVLLDDVLIQASQRLNVMSKGRYRLLRKEDRAKGNKASGLELEVEDSYSGKTRSVATLSGGESFLAALSLALGLSDVVQSYAGGIKLDTLFIDEGFGSLDSESLDLALRTLIDLQASGRTIGIISHVSELKEQMALRVDVISERQSSRIAIIGG